LALYHYPRAYAALRLIRPAIRAVLFLACLKPRLAQYKISWALGIYEGYAGKLWDNRLTERFVAGPARKAHNEMSRVR
jgi:hypothetical protein